MVLNISPKRVFRRLGIVVVCLTFLSVITQLTYYIWGFDFQMFNLDLEENVPTWYQTSTLLLVSTLLALIASSRQQLKARYSRYWWGLAFIFLYLSLDELAAIHEKADWVLRSWIHGSGIFLFVWLIPAGVLLLILAMFYLGFLLHLPRGTGGLMMLAGVLFLAGAAGLELVIELMVAQFGLDLTDAKQPAYVAASTIGEVLEMTGVLVLIYTLLSYLGLTTQEISVRFQDD